MRSVRTQHVFKRQQHRMSHRLLSSTGQLPALYEAAPDQCVTDAHAIPRLCMHSCRWRHRRVKSSGDESHTRTNALWDSLGRARSDKYTSAGCGSLPVSLDTCSPEHLLDPAVGPVSI